MNPLETCTYLQIFIASSQ